LGCIRIFGSLLGHSGVIRIFRVAINVHFNKSTISAIIILVSLATIIGLSGLNFLIPKNLPTNQNNQTETSSYQGMNKIFLTTQDNVKIASDVYEVENPVGWLVLVHMMPAVKESWQNLATDLANQGYESIAIDLRGHGESDGGLNGYLKFSDADNQKSISDLEVAVNYLIQERGATPDKISFIGASIGANLSLQYISENSLDKLGTGSEFSAKGGSASGGKTAVLLSAGLNYHGIKTEPLVKNLKAGQKVFFVSAKDDDNNAEESQKLFDLTPAGVEKEIKIYDSGGHGTNILGNQSDLNNLILNFIK